jgi:hypothetical protein
MPSVVDGYSFDAEAQAAAYREALSKLHAFDQTTGEFWERKAAQWSDLSEADKSDRLSHLFSRILCERDFLVRDVNDAIALAVQVIESGNSETCQVAEAPTITAKSA